MSLSVHHVQQFFNSYQDLKKFFVAYSGGLDSTVLLHLMHNARLPIQAVYVNHHLQNESDDWERHCKENCKNLNISFSVLHAEVEKVAQKSIEDCARKARYNSLHALLNDSSALVTAHHQDDLAETILLQLLRGAGPAGLAAMPKFKKLSKGIHLRPLLDFSRVEIHEYAKSHQLNWIDDPSNDSLDFDRNYIRNIIMPKLSSRWPGAQQTFARSASLQAEAMYCLHELAEIDISSARTKHSMILNISALQELNDVRLKNVLRYWIRTHNIRVPNRKILQHIVTDIVKKEDIETSPLQTWKEGEIRRYRNQLYLMVPLQPHSPTQVLRWKIDQPLFIESLNRTLRREELEKYGLKLPAEINELTVRFREGGERFKLFGQKQHRSLKNLLNEAEIPPWERNRIPLLFHNDQLISVLGYWNAEIDCET